MLKFYTISNSICCNVSYFSNDF